MKTTHFAYRHIGPRSSEVNEMLAEVEADSLDELCQQTIPESIRLDKQMNLPTAMSEAECLNHIADLGSKNKVAKIF